MLNNLHTTRHITPARISYILTRSLFILGFLLSVSVAQAQVVVIVNAGNADNLSKAEISRIFLGKLDSFPSGGQTVPLNQPAESPVRNTFDSEMLGRPTQQVTAYWNRLLFTGNGTPPEELPDDAAVVAAVAGNVNAISYVDSSAVTDAVRVVHTVGQ